jgi:hypothetical protein
MDGVHVAKRRDGEAGVSENLDNRERAIDVAASRDPNDSMVAMRCTKPPIMGISSSSMLSSSAVPVMNATDDRACWVTSTSDAGLCLCSIEGL